MPNLLQLKKLEEGIGYDLIEENVKIAPELGVIDADTLTGTEMSLTVRTDLPGVSFTRPNEGVGTSESRFVTRLFQTANLDAFIKCDVRVLKKFKPEAGSRWMSGEQSGYIESAMRHAAAQFYYGTTNDAKGFPGIIAQMENDADHVIDLGGSANKSSVFFVADGPGKVQWLFGNDQTLTFEDWFKQTVPAEDDATKVIEAMCSWMHWAPGMRVSNRNSVVRIKGIDDSGNKLGWDDMQDGLQLMTDLKMTPTKILMTGRSRRHLRDASKTALITNPPLPTEFEGIPIIQTASILNAETI